MRWLGSDETLEIAGFSIRGGFLYVGSIPDRLGSPDASQIDPGLQVHVGAIARRLQATPGQVALAWLLHQGHDVVPIPGTKRRSFLEENCASAQLALTRTDLDALNAAAPAGGTAGPRYTEKMMSMVDR